MQRFNMDKRKWDSIPISKDIMNLTFSDRKAIQNDYDEILAKELQQKYLGSSSFRIDKVPGGGQLG
jgi:hypothetical protein